MGFFQKKNFAIGRNQTRRIRRRAFSHIHSFIQTTRSSNTRTNNKKNIIHSNNNLSKKKKTMAIGNTSEILTSKENSNARIRISSKA